MYLSLEKSDLYDYVKKQISYFFPDGKNSFNDDVKKAFATALDRVENCFCVINNKAYSDESNNAYFSHLHSDQYAQFLYFFSNSLWKCSENKNICDKLMGLNRILNNLFISYKCELPEHFFLGHAFGTIIGNACFDDFLCVSHLVTINTGNEIDGKRTPHIGRGVWFGPNSKVIGDKKIGDRVSIGVDAVVYDKEVKDDSIVVNRGKGIEILDNKREICKAQQYFKVKI